MKKHGLSILPVMLLTMILLVVFPGSISAQPYSHLSLDPNRIQWNYLLYEVKSTSADVTTEVRLEFPTQAETKAAMIESRQGDPLPVPAAGCYKITVNTSVRLGAACAGQISGPSLVRPAERHRIGAGYVAAG